MPITLTTGRAALRVARRDIRFHSPCFERVHVEITVRNEGDALSRPTPLRVEAAHFGAFVPWRPLAERVVPPVPPGGARTVAFDVERPRVRSIGSVDDTSPGGLLTAVAGGDGRAGGLPGDLLQLLGRRRTHWVGNLNVFLGEQRVERHRAPALRVHAGRANVAMFCLGSGADAYCFDYAGEGAAWCPTAGYPSGRGGPFRNLVAGRGTTPIEPGRWFELPGPAMVLLAVHPPEDAARGALDVHVRQRSSGETAVVEFDLDPRAAGPGCYTL